MPHDRVVLSRGPGIGSVAKGQKMKDAAGTKEVHTAQSLRPTDETIAYLAAVVEHVERRDRQQGAGRHDHELERERGAHVRVSGRGDHRAEHPAADSGGAAAEEDEILSRLRAGGYIEHYETVRLTKDGRRLDVSLVDLADQESGGRGHRGGQDRPRHHGPQAGRRATDRDDREVRVGLQSIGDLRRDHGSRGQPPRDQRPRSRRVRLHARGGARPAVLVDAVVARRRRGAGPHPGGVAAGCRR